MRISKRSIDALKKQEADYFVWDEDLPGFGVRVFASGRKSYLVQYRNLRRTRRITLGLHGALTPEDARKLAKAHLGDIAKGGDPAEVRKLDREGMTVAELCDRYLADAELGLVPGKRRMPKKASTLATDRSRIDAHIKPLLGTRLVKEVGRAEVYGFLRDVAAGKARRDRRTKPRGRSIVRGGLPTAGRTLGLLGGIFTYAVRNGIVETNPVRGVPKPASNVRQRRLTSEEYRQLGKMLRKAEADGHNPLAIDIIRVLALTGCRRGEIEKLKWSEVDEGHGCLRLADTKEGRSIRPAGLVVFALLKARKPAKPRGYVFPSSTGDGRFEGLSKVWEKVVKPNLPDVTPHVLRHSFASAANELGYTEATIAAMLGHAAGTTTSRYVHALDGALTAAADRVSLHIDGLLGARTADTQRLSDMFAAWAEATDKWSSAASTV
ncbi:tyrosine-type recombinase/integrase [Caulobacter sp. KR2-114]|uniref:tyrosine-type recombinase/integrase n=1 Tax=Caulobacter sp. KR2-114 TaxID=3400912 RepID=UPI003BFB9B21